jgi:hypothetical protein
MRAFVEAASGRAVDADPVASFPPPTALARSGALAAGVRPGPVVPPVPVHAPTALAVSPPRPSPLGVRSGPSYGRGAGSPPDERGPSRTAA